ncbi:unnamed protein product [Rotaria sordida]|uniref:Uncharacterized protein n=1 Tax=Rotaria sordida TaxID=392033 RepID=A0A819QYQ5_9BILA|nr:unnamed protein product [Rotaria sordida]CAF4033334.1 unnamed protein product [Rotaria sordida]
MFSNGTCNCVTSTTCQEPMRIGPPDLVIPGLVVGCWPIDGLGMSTLECFYSSSCIELIINFLNYYTQMDGSPPVDFVLPTVPTLIVTPLNSSIPSRFPPNITIGKIIDELFIEQWSNKISLSEKIVLLATVEVDENTHKIVVRRFVHIVNNGISIFDSGGVTNDCSK